VLGLAEGRDGGLTYVNVEAVVAGQCWVSCAVRQLAVDEARAEGCLEACTCISKYNLILIVELTEIIRSLEAVEDIIMPFLGSSRSLKLRQSCGLSLASWLGGDNSLWFLDFAHVED